jgi:hypothetical protein
MPCRPGTVLILIHADLALSILKALLYRPTHCGRFAQLRKRGPSTNCCFSFVPNPKNKKETICQRTNAKRRVAPNPIHLPLSSSSLYPDSPTIVFYAACVFL